MKVIIKIIKNEQIKIQSKSSITYINIMKKLKEIWNFTRIN